MGLTSYIKLFSFSYSYYLIYIFFTVSNPAFAEGVERISTLASVGPYPDPKVRLAALSKILKTAPHPNPPQNEGMSIHQPSDVLKLLFVQDLRELQTKINEALVAVQTVTADPRTDTRLGKVGR